MATSYSFNTLVRARRCGQIQSEVTWRWWLGFNTLVRARRCGRMLELPPLCGSESFNTLVRARRCGRKITKPNNKEHKVSTPSCGQGAADSKKNCVLQNVI